MLGGIERHAVSARHVGVAGHLARLLRREVGSCRLLWRINLVGVVDAILIARGGLRGIQTGLKEELLATMHDAVVLEIR